MAGRRDGSPRGGECPPSIVSLPFPRRYQQFGGSVVNGLTVQRLVVVLGDAGTREPPFREKEHSRELLGHRTRSSC